MKNGQSDEAQKTCQHGVDSQRPCGQIHGPSAAPARCVSTVVVTGVNHTKDGNCVRTRAGRCISKARELTTVTRVNHLKTLTDLLMFSLGVPEPIHKSLSESRCRKRTSNLTAKLLPPTPSHSATPFIKNGLFS